MNYEKNKKLKYQEWREWENNVLYPMYYYYY